MNHKPVSPLKLNPKLPPELEGIIGRAMEKERGQRYPDALAMKGDLQSLKRETEPGMTDTARMRPLLPYRISSSTFQTTSRKSTLHFAGRDCAAVSHCSFPWGRGSSRQTRPTSHARTSIAVLPLQNMNGDVSVDFLRFALADEVANALTNTRTLECGPFIDVRANMQAMMSIPARLPPNFAWAPIVTGHFLQQGDNLDGHSGSHGWRVARNWCGRRM